MEKIKSTYKIIILILIIISIPNNTFATDNDVITSQIKSLQISDFLDEVKNYTKENFEEIDIKEMFYSAISGEIDKSTILKKTYNIIGKELISSLKLIGSIAIILSIHSILKSISDSLENNSVSQIIYYVQYIMIVSIIMINFTEIIQVFTQATNKLMDFCNTLIPLLITLMITTGNLVSANVVQPVLLILVTFIGNAINTIIVPLLFISTALGTISNISDRIQIDKLSKFLKSSITWGLGILITLFVTVLSLEGTLSSSVDGITAKTVKSAVSTLIPVVGKVLGDATDTVLGCANILKNAVGIIGGVVILLICLIPILKTATITIVYYLTSAICQPIADSKIIKLLEQLGGTFKVMLGIICAISAMLIIGITIVIKITNNGLMYR